MSDAYLAMARCLNGERFFENASFAIWPSTIMTIFAVSNDLQLTKPNERNASLRNLRKEVGRMCKGYQKSVAGYSDFRKATFRPYNINLFFLMIHCLCTGGKL